VRELRKELVARGDRRGEVDFGRVAVVERDRRPRGALEQRDLVVGLRAGGELRRVVARVLLGGMLAADPGERVRGPGVERGAPGRRRFVLAVGERGVAPGLVRRLGRERGELRALVLAALERGLLLGRDRLRARGTPRYRVVPGRALRRVGDRVEPSRLAAERI